MPVTPKDFVPVGNDFDMHKSLIKSVHAERFPNDNPVVGSRWKSVGFVVSCELGLGPD